MLLGLGILSRFSSFAVDFEDSVLVLGPARRGNEASPSQSPLHLRSEINQ